MIILLRMLPRTVVASTGQGGCYGPIALDVTKDCSGLYWSRVVLWSY